MDRNSPFKLRYATRGAQFVMGNYQFPNMPIRPRNVTSYVATLSSTPAQVVGDMNVDSSGSSIEGTLDDIISLPSPAIICVDMNVHYVLWGSSYIDRCGIKIHETLAALTLIILNTGKFTGLNRTPYHNTCQDVTFVSPSFAPYLAWDTIGDSMGSDHLPIILTIDFKVPYNYKTVPLERSRNYKKANWELYSTKVELTAGNLAMDRDPLVQYDNFVNTLQSSHDAAVPTSHSEGHRIVKRCPWWTGSRSKVFAQRRLSLYTSKQNFNLINYESYYRTAAATRIKRFKGIVTNFGIPAINLEAWAESFACRVIPSSVMCTPLEFPNLGVPELDKCFTGSELRAASNRVRHTMVGPMSITGGHDALWDMSVVLTILLSGVKIVTLPVEQKLNEVRDRSESGQQLQGVSKNIEALDGVEPGVHRLAKAVDLSSLDASEEDKIQAMMTQSTQDYNPSNYMKIRGANQIGEVPVTYRCYKCHQQGHWIKNCPLSVNQSYGSRLRHNMGFDESLRKNHNRRDGRTHRTSAPVLTTTTPEPSTSWTRYLTKGQHASHHDHQTSGINLSRLSEPQPSPLTSPHSPLHFSPSICSFGSPTVCAPQPQSFP
uniref:CCHC-type domain-containing protein n=1 Tax=Timema shepardi TaxID=629360 RepID=A0A7R9AMP3_TIMSH|nr:unnamed protein product [Timema shepardi]